MYGETILKFNSLLHVSSNPIQSRDKISNSLFCDTNWTDLIENLRHEDEDKSCKALEQLCIDYQRPIFAYILRQGVQPDDAKDICQNFFIHILSKDRFAGVSRAGGKFRNWLLACLKHFLSHVRDFENAAKRRPQGGFCSLDELYEIQSFVAAFPADVDPTLLYDSEFAHALTAKAREEVRNEYIDRGSGQLFDALIPWIFDPPSQELKESILAGLGITDSNFRVSIHRLKNAFCDRMKFHVSLIVNDEAEIMDEFRHLMMAVQLTPRS